MNHNLTVRKFEVTTKSFPIFPVMGVVTGIVLEENGFQGIHELMDHFFPGIMTMGAAIMMPVAKEEILKQHPFLKDISECTKDNYKKWIEEEMKKLPAFLDITGPVHVDSARRKKLSEDFLKGAMSR